MTVEEQIDHERGLAAKVSAALLVEEQPIKAWNTLARSVEKQAQLAGIRDADLGVTNIGPNKRWYPVPRPGGPLPLDRRGFR